MSQYVGPVGPTDAKIALVGEAPGEVEVQRGEPFVGKSGTLMMNLLASVGLTRSSVYLTNVVKERPSDNDITPMFQINRGGSVTTSEEFMAHVDLLKEELEMIDANVIVPLGNTALWALTKNIYITKWRGSIIQSTLLPGRKCIPTIHPRKALEAYLYRRYISMDLQRIIEESETPDMPVLERELIVQPSFFDIMSFLEHVEATFNTVAVDIEVLRGFVSCISFAADKYSMSIPFVWEKGDYLDPSQEVQVWRRISHVLENPKIRKVGQNITFDATFLYRTYGIRTTPIEDTMVGMGILYPDFPKGLDFITSIYTKEPYYKADGKLWFKIGGSFSDLWVYNAKDSAVTLESYHPILYDLRRQGNLETYQNQVKIVEPLILMQETGLKMDLEGKALASKKAGEELESLQLELNELVGETVNISSPKQVCDLLYTKKGIKPYTHHKTHQPTANAMALKRLKRKGSEEAAIILKMRALTKAKSSYFDMTLDEDGYIRSSFNPVGTVSGRLSSSQTISKTGGNLQNLPEAIKALIMAEEGSVFYNLDLAQAENRNVAYMAPEPLMINAFESGIDVHRQTAALIFHKNIEDISDEEGSSPVGGGLYSERFWGKKANHGLNYDLGYKSFAMYYEIPEKEARFIIDRYMQAYPGVRHYHEWIKQQLNKNRTLTNPFGRVRTFYDRWSDALWKSAYSWLPQSTVADKINRDGLNYIYYNQDLFKPITIANQVHDSILLKVPLSSSWEDHAKMLLLIKAKLETPIEWKAYSYSIPVDIHMGVRLGKKNLKEVKVNAGATPSELAKSLDEIYGKLGSTDYIQAMVRDINDSSLSPEESLT